MYKKILLSACISILLLILPVVVHHAFALNMSNSQWILQMGSVNNNFAGTKSGGIYKLRDTGGQIAPGQYGDSHQAAIVKAGFQYVGSLTPFSFRISGEGVTQVNFGIIDPTNPVLRSQILTITNGSAHGFAVTLMENHALLVPSSGWTIPDTICDTGPCTTTIAHLWSNPLTFGFGYRCDGLGITNYCPGDFATTDYYRPIANRAANQDPATVMSGSNVGRNMQVQITYKVNVSTSQAAGLYSNVLTYVATPTF